MLKKFKEWWKNRTIKKYGFEIVPVKNGHNQGLRIISPDKWENIQILHTDKGIDVDFRGNIKLNIHGSLEISTDGETNFVSHGDTNIDTWRSTLNINSRKAKQIKDLKEAIVYRKEVDKFMEKMDDWKVKNRDKLIEAFDRKISNDDNCDHNHNDCVEEGK